MFSLYYKLDDTYEVDGENYHLDASFDNILRLVDLRHEKEVSSKNIVLISIKLLFGKDTPILELPFKQINDIYLDVFKTYVNLGKEPEIKLDLAGNPLPPEFQEDKNKHYSLKYDAEYIYSSFMQAYNIDLIEQQGKLHWFKFQALLVGLPEDTKFRQVVSIRMWKKKSKPDNEEVKMLELQEIYKLPESEVD